MWERQRKNDQQTCVGKMSSPTTSTSSIPNTTTTTTTATTIVCPTRTTSSKRTSSTGACLSGTTCRGKGAVVLRNARTPGSPTVRTMMATTNAVVPALDAESSKQDAEEEEDRRAGSRSPRRHATEATSDGGGVGAPRETPGPCTTKPGKKRGPRGPYTKKGTAATAIAMASRTTSIYTGKGTAMHQKWNAYYTALHEYVRANGGVYPHRGDLHNWCKSQRYRYTTTPQHGTLTPHMIGALERLPNWFWKQQRQQQENSTTSTATNISTTSSAPTLCTQISKQKVNSTTPKSIQKEKYSTPATRISNRSNTPHKSIFDVLHEAKNWSALPSMSPHPLLEYFKQERATKPRGYLRTECWKHLTNPTINTVLSDVDNDDDNDNNGHEPLLFDRSTLSYSSYKVLKKNRHTPLSLFEKKLILSIDTILRSLDWNVFKGYTTTADHDYGWGNYNDCDPTKDNSQSDNTKNGTRTGAQQDATMPENGVIRGSNIANGNVLIAEAVKLYSRAKNSKNMQRVNMQQHVYGPVAEKYKQVQTKSDVVVFLKSKTRTIKTRGRKHDNNNASASAASSSASSILKRKLDRTLSAALSSSSSSSSSSSTSCDSNSNTVTGLDQHEGKEEKKEEELDAFQDINKEDNDTKSQKKMYEGRRMWIDIEKNCIKEGIQNHGLGKWALIKNENSTILRHRTSGQIKDCFRTMKKRGELDDMKEAWPENKDSESSSSTPVTEMPNRVVPATTSSSTTTTQGAAIAGRLDHDRDHDVAFPNDDDGGNALFAEHSTDKKNSASASSSSASSILNRELDGTLSAALSSSSTSCDSNSNTGTGLDSTGDSNNNTVNSNNNTNSNNISTKKKKSSTGAAASTTNNTITVAKGNKKKRREEYWMMMLQRLVVYKSNHNGSTKVPRTYTADPALALWVARQRKINNKNDLLPTRYELLESIQFDWGTGLRCDNTLITSKYTPFPSHSNSNTVTGLDQHEGKEEEKEEVLDAFQDINTEEEVVTKNRRPTRDDGNDDNDTKTGSVKFFNYERLTLYRELNNALKTAADAFIARNNNNKNKKTLDIVKAYVKDNYAELMEEFDDDNTEGRTGERSQKLKLVESKNNNKDDTDENIDNDDEVTTTKVEDDKNNEFQLQEVGSRKGAITTKRKNRSFEKWTEKEIAVSRKGMALYGKSWNQNGCRRDISTQIAKLIPSRSVQGVHDKCREIFKKENESNNIYDNDEGNDDNDGEVSMDKNTVVAANATSEAVAATTNNTLTRTTRHVSSNKITADDMTTRTIRRMSAKRHNNTHDDDEISVETAFLPVKKKQKCNTARGSVTDVGRATQKWNSNYNAVKKHIESHNGRYPKILQKHKNGITGMNLGRWVNYQKSNMKLTQQKVTDLEKLPNWRWSHSRTKQQKSISRKSGGKDCPEKQVGFVNSSSSKSASTLRTAALNIQEEETAKAKETSAHTGINMTLAEVIKAAEEKTQQDGDKNKDPSFVWV